MLLFSSHIYIDIITPQPPQPHCNICNLYNYDIHKLICISSETHDDRRLSLLLKSSSFSTYPPLPFLSSCGHNALSFSSFFISSDCRNCCSHLFHAFKYFLCVCGMIYVEVKLEINLIYVKCFHIVHELTCEHIVCNLRCFLRVSLVEQHVNSSGLHI